MPIIFCFFVFLTDNVNYNDQFELRKYSATSKYWLGDLSQEYSVEDFQFIQYLSLLFTNFLG